MSSLDFNISSRPEFAFLTVQLPQAESLKVESAAMASMDTNLKMTVRAKGGLKRLITRENLFINEFQAQGGAGEISIAPGPSGDIAHQYVDDRNTIYLSSGAFLASSKSVQLDTKWQGMAKGFFSGGGLFLIKCSGEGDLWFNSYGAIFEVDVKDEYIVDTGHIMGFSSSLDYQISKMGGYKSLFFSGEGLVCRFKGEGKVWVQTKNPNSFVGWADAYRIVQRRSSN
jgi:uncharacterized protein (TIGR00266 family)